MADVTKINGYIIKDANAPHPSNAGSAGQVLKKTETGTEWADASFKPAGKSYLTFSSPNSFTLKVNDTTKHWNGTLEYFSSNRTWTVWDGTTTLSAVTDDGEYVLYLRGTGNTVITGINESYRWVLTGSDIACIGNIENLLDYATVESGNHPTMADYCYFFMFQGCTSLTQAPALPAITLASECYDSMFYGCTSLTQAPALPATTLTNRCYNSMFQDCTGLTQASALPATTLTNRCYYYMFQGCTSLKLSSTQTDEYMQEYRIPVSGTGTSASDALTNMFTSTGGTFTGTPEINTTYYLSSDNMIVRETEIATLNGYVGSMIMVGAIPVNEKGAANGVASLGADGKVPSAQLPEMGGKAYTVLLRSTGWAQSGNGYSQTVNVTGVTASSNGSLRIAQSATDEQFAAWGAAKPRVTAQAAGTLTVKAAGTVPTIDIPVEVLIV